MPNWLLITLVFACPFIISAIGLVILQKWQNQNLDNPINLSQAWHRLLSLIITPRKIFALLLTLFPFIFLDNLIGILPNYIIPVTLIGWITYKLFNRQSQLSTESQEILETLNAMTSKMGESRLYLEHLANLIKTKDTEIKEKELIRTALENQISQKTRESEVWNNFTQEQQELFIQSIKQSQSKGVIKTSGIILGSLSLNIIATLIWTLLGNPGKDEIMKRLTVIGDWFNRFH